MSKGNNTFEDVLFKPSVVNSLRQGGTQVTNVTLGGASTEMESVQSSPTGTFRYDPPGSALKSTQQLNVDWSKFENHTFLNSAEMKVQAAFDKIINHFPFDGTSPDYQLFMDQLSGYERYVFKKFPKHLGYLNFKRVDESASPINNYISVLPISDASQLSPSLAGSGEYVLTLNKSPFTAEMHLMIPASANDNNVILQKVSDQVSGQSTKGITLALSMSSDASKANIITLVSSGTEFISSSVQITKGEFNHIASVYDRFGTGKINTYVNGVLGGTSPVGVFGDLGIEDAPLLIGSGSSHGSSGKYVFVPASQLSGAMDELRIFESVRSLDQLKSFSNSSIFAPPDKSLKLYYRFNEPQGSFGASQNNSLILDHSGYGLHSKVIMGSGGSFDMSLRSTSSMPTPLLSENKDFSPVLFPAYEGVSSLCTDLLASGSTYDWNNPNLVTKLIPKHYLLEEQAFQGLLDENGDISINYGYTSDIPGGGKIQSAQIISSMLYLWAETFDEIKMFVDEFGRLLKVDYLSDQTISNHLLPFLSRYYGFSLPNSFANSNMKQFFEGADLNVTSTKPSESLQYIQNTIWRRVLTDLPNLFQARGTRESIEGLFRGMGIKPNGTFRIKEYGGSKTKKISDAYEKRSEIAAMLDFSGSNTSAGTVDPSGKDSQRPLIQSSYLSASRVEPGVPLPGGTFVDGISNNINDGLLTSGSWSVEGIFKFETNTVHPVTQSLMRLQTTGSDTGTANNWLQFNTTAFATITGVSTGSLAVFGRPTAGPGAPTMKLVLTGVNIFDGNKWHVSFGRKRNDQADSYTSSSYFLRAGKMGATRIESFSENTVFFNDSGSNALNVINSLSNASGSFVAIGSQSLPYKSSVAGGFLNLSLIHI